LLLEVGRTVTAEADFPLPAVPERRLFSRLTGMLNGQHVQTRCAVYSQRTRDFFVSDRENPYTTPHGKPFNWYRGRQVGGRLHTWARMALRMSESNFKAASWDGYGVDWPISYRDLAPYYDKVESFLGVYGTAECVPSLPDGKYIGPHALTPAEEAFKVAIEQRFSDRRVISARLVKHSSDRVPSTLRAASATGRLTLRSNSVVSRVSVDPRTGRASGVGFLDRISKEPFTVRSNVVVLCASTVETLRILLNSACSRHPRGLGNSSGNLGHYFMSPVLTGLGGPLPEDATHVVDGEDADPYDFGRLTGFYIPRFRNVDRRHPDFIRGYGIQGAIGRATPTWYLLGKGEMLPRFENAVTLDPRRKDAWGIPAAYIDCTVGPNELAMTADQIRSAQEIASAAGFTIRMPPSGNVIERMAFRLWRSRLLSASGAFLPGSAIHEMGGAGMGNDPQKFVLNKFNQCWDAPNVFVTDGACFVSGFCQHMTLTIMALTARACDHIVQEYGVGKSLVASTA
jgi:choline dehydrogenase-like flavoprotein